MYIDISLRSEQISVGFVPKYLEVMCAGACSASGPSRSNMRPKRRTIRMLHPCVGVLNCPMGNLSLSFVSTMSLRLRGIRRVLWLNEYLPSLKNCLIFLFELCARADYAFVLLLKNWSWHRMNNKLNHLLKWKRIRKKMNILKEWQNNLRCQMNIQDPYKSTQEKECLL